MVRSYVTPSGACLLREVDALSDHGHAARQNGSSIEATYLSLRHDPRRSALSVDEVSLTITVQIADVAG